MGDQCAWAESYHDNCGQDKTTWKVKCPQHDKWWLNAAHIVVGLTFASTFDNVWLRAAGYAFAVLAFGMLLHTLYRRRRG